MGDGAMGLWENSMVAAEVSVSLSIADSTVIGEIGSELFESESDDELSDHGAVIGAGAVVMDCRPLALLVWARVGERVSLG